MQKWSRNIGLAILVCVFLLFSSNPAAASQPPKGLLITPVREYVTVAPGQSQTNQITVADVTDQSLDVNLSVQQFSVANYTYNFSFTPVKDNWITFSTSFVHLRPGESKVISYTIAAPKNAVPGGHYFTLFASTSLCSGAVVSNMQVTTVVYATVDGQLTRSSSIVKSMIPSIIFGNTVSFTFDVRNTGNTHFFIYPTGQLMGPSAKPVSTGSAHITLPGTIRTMGGTISAPLLPGVYTAMYGYKTDTGQMVTVTRTIIYLPPWTFIIPLGLVIAGIAILKRRKITFKNRT